MCDARGVYVAGAASLCPDDEEKFQNFIVRRDIWLFSGTDASRAALFRCIETTSIQSTTFMRPGTTTLYSATSRSLLISE